MVTLIAGLYLLAMPSERESRITMAGQLATEGVCKWGWPSTADDDPRITRVEMLIRQCKLAELPVHMNVFIGI